MDAGRPTARPNGSTARTATRAAATGAAAASKSEPDKMAPHRGAPEKIVPTTKVNVAFPFSQIKIQEPSRDLAALAALLADLAGLVAEAAPGPKAQALELRARELAGKLR
jgi:hypothetical protein